MGVSARGRWSRERCAAVARLPRRRSRLPPKARHDWAHSTGAPNDGEVLCHGDFAPWNLVWRDQEAVGIFDWDFVRPAEPMFDVYYAMDWTVPFRDDQTCREFHHFESTPTGHTAWGSSWTLTVSTSRLRTWLPGWLTFADESRSQQRRWPNEALSRRRNGWRKGCSKGLRQRLSGLSPTPPCSSHKQHPLQPRSARPCR